MPRDVNGNYTLPAGNPVAAGTTIEADWANTTLADLAAAMTDSLSRSGLGGLLAAMEFPDGTEANPGISFTNEPTSGWYRESLNNFWFSVGNQDVLNITKTTVSLAVGIVPDGFVNEDVLDNGFTMDGGSVLGRIDPATGAVESMTFEELAAELAAASGGLLVHGQCRLVYGSASQVSLERFNGPGGLIINGAMEQIPAIGVAATNSGLSADTTYYVYAFMNAGVMELELSTTVPDALDGIAIKTGDSTRTLVGIVRPNAVGDFTNIPNRRFVRSWFNEGLLTGGGSFTSASTTGTSGGALASSTKLEFLVFPGEQMTANFAVTFTDDGSGALQVQANIGLDGATSAAGDGVGVELSYIAPPGTINQNSQGGGFRIISPTLGYHWIQGVWLYVAANNMFGAFRINYTFSGPKELS